MTLHYVGFEAGAFGAAATGTRAVPYTKTVDQDQSSTSSTGQKQTVHLNSISAMKQYEGKSPEELHWEDYQVWCHCTVHRASQLDMPARATSQRMLLSATSMSSRRVSRAALGSRPQRVCLGSSQHPLALAPLPAPLLAVPPARQLPLEEGPLACHNLPLG